jgi:bacillithiol biosynthesis deacetylase BshB1
MKLDILAFGAHPDDVELACAGTLLKEVNAGKKIGIIDLTGGELGTRGSKEIRAEESEKSARYMGISIRKNLDLGDGFFEINQINILKIVKQIRIHQPQLVLTNAPNDRHPDHGRGCELVERACFLSGLIKIETSHNGELQKPWRPNKVLNYIQDNYIEPDIVIDVSDYIDEKIETIMCYSSQFYDKDSKEPETPISSEQFLEHVKGRAVQFGRGINAKYGEGYTCSSYVGINSVLDII